jgi:mandelate racemase
MREDLAAGQEHLPMDSTNLPRIRALKARAVCVPMREPHRTASGVITESPLVLIDLVTTENITGHSVVFAYTAAALRPLAELVSNLEQIVAGEPLAPSTVADKLAARFRLLGTQGLVGMAIGGVDMALWDALACVHQVPLVHLLGGSAKRLPAYGAVGYDGAVESARVAEDWAKRGFGGVKAKIGYPTTAEDVEVVRAIRGAVGASVAIMVDYNQCLTPADAAARIRRLEEFGLTWVEEPTLAHDFEGHAIIASEVDAPIQCGENWWGPLDVRQAIQARASDFVMLEAMKMGGVTGWRRGAALAEAHGIRVSSHLWPEISAHLLCTTPMSHWLEYADWWNAVLQNPLQIDAGFAIPSNEPGSGVRWNEAFVSKYLA